MPVSMWNGLVETTAEEETEEVGCGQIVESYMPDKALKTVTMAINGGSEHF